MTTFQYNGKYIFSGCVKYVVPNSLLSFQYISLHGLTKHFF